MIYNSNFSGTLRGAILSGLMALAVLPCTAATFYVSPFGNDANPGTLAQPFQTVAHARDAMRRFLPSMSEDITIYLRGGEYRPNQPIEFTPADSGRNGHIVCYRNMPGEVPILTGRTLVRGWQLQDAEKDIWKASVPPGIGFRQLYVDGVKANIARSVGSLGLSNAGRDFSSADPSLRSLSDSKSIQDMVVVTQSGWVRNLLPVGRISKTGIVSLKEPFRTVARPGICNFAQWIENAYEFLAKPGDWCLQIASGTVYYIPRAGENMTSAVAQAPVLEQLIVLSGTQGDPVANLRFEGLSFQATTWNLPGKGYGLGTPQANQPYDTDPAAWVMKAALDGIWLQNVDVARCTFAHLGGNGVNILKGSRNSVVDHCLFEDLSGSALQVGRGWKADGEVPADSPEIIDGIIVSNNMVHDVCVDYPSGCGIYAGYTRDCTFTHNTLYNLPYTGISLGWGWGYGPTHQFTTGNFIDGNLIHDHMLLLNDGGAIYCNGWQFNATLSNNYAYHQGHPFGVYYLDDGAANWSVFDNVARKDSAACWYLYKGYCNHCYDNFVDNPYVMDESKAACTCAGNTVVTGSNYPAAAQAIVNAAGPETGVYYTSRPGSTIIGKDQGNGDFSQGLQGWTVGGSMAGWDGVVAGLHPGEEMPPEKRSITFHAKGAKPGATLECHFNAVARHVYALSYGQAGLGSSTAGQSLSVSVDVGTPAAIPLGASNTPATDHYLYARFVRTFRVAAAGVHTLRFTDLTPASNAAKSDCMLDRVELRDVTPPTW